MKTSQFIAAIALAGFASAQSQCDSAAEAIPACGTTCLISAGSAKGCVSTDYACQCSNSAAIMSTCQDQVISQCGGVGSALSVQQSAQAVCSCAASYPAGSGSSSSPATTTAPGSSASAPTGSTPTASVPTGGSSSRAGTTAAPSSTSKNGTSSALPTFTNGGITASSFMPVGGALGLFLGLLAYL